MTDDLAPPPPQCSGLALIGYRGSGKSTVGTILAGWLGRAFIDVDLEIEARAGRSIAAIFAESGEGAFRDWEEATIAEITARNASAVLATGGGAVLREVNRSRIRSLGFVVWLTAPPPELARRLEIDRRGLAERPPLTGAGTLLEISHVLAERSPYYRELADLVIDTAGQTPTEVARAILGRWNPAGTS
jgi:shikimate kinase